MSLQAHSLVFDRHFLEIPSARMKFPSKPVGYLFVKQLSNNSVIKKKGMDYWKAEASVEGLRPLFQSNLCSSLLSLASTFKNHSSYAVSTRIIGNYFFSSEAGD